MSILARQLSGGFLSDSCVGTSDNRNLSALIRNVGRRVYWRSAPILERIEIGVEARRVEVADTSVPEVTDEQGQDHGNAYNNPRAAAHFDG